MSNEIRYSTNISSFVSSMQFVSGNILEEDFLNPTNELLTAYGENAGVSQDCTWYRCERHCQQMGYPDGRCVNGRCRCDSRRSATSAVPALFMKLGKLCRNYLSSRSRVTTSFY